MREILFRGFTPDENGKDTAFVNGEWIKGQWVQGSYWELNKTTYCFKEDYERDPGNTEHYIVFDQMTDWGLPNRHLKADVIPETVGQYTGLTDKNGKKIFEGDILKGKHNWHNWNTSFGNDERDFFEQKIRGAYGKHKSEEYAMFDKDRYFYFRNYAVEYFVKNGGYRVRNGGQFHALTQTYIYNRDLEVIGNIHDNPELLKGEEENA